MRNTVWTSRRATGMLLILGCLLFLGAAGLIPTDRHGNFVVNLPLREQLPVLAAHPQQWQWSLSVFTAGVLVTLLGLVLLTELFRAAGDRAFSPLALLTFLFGDVLIVINLAFGFVEPWAAQETARTGVVPASYVPLTLWTGALFVIYTILAFSALVAYGGAVLSTRVLPHWVGWLSMLYGLAGLGVFGVTGGAPPFLHHLMPIVLGILLLLPQRVPRSGSKPTTTVHAP
jgi:hypothetical protein